MGSRVTAIIPARFDSTRLPGKPLAQIGGKPMIERVVASTAAVPGVGRVIVATDDERIAAAVRAFGGEVAMTRADHPSGTDRIAEVARGLGDDIIVNVQGDLPFLEAHTLERAVALMTDDPDLPMATVREPIVKPEEMHNPNVVKVVTDRAGNALYFSRAPLPYWRDAADTEGAEVVGYRHLGLYVYRRDFLLQFASMPPTPLERAEKLEQLRALENGYRIRVADCEGGLGIEVDTPADLARANAHVAG
jgi:3-deoxy-manno-octulosonate cytidylyltransferase (CMP-KDO synthetase)